MSQSLSEKARLYCDINEIEHPELYIQGAEKIEQTSFQEYVFLIKKPYILQGIHDLKKGVIDDETFFMIGDISSNYPLFQTKSPFEYVDNLSTNRKNTPPKSTLFLVDELVFSYTKTRFGSDFTSFLDALSEHQSAWEVLPSSGSH